MIRRSRPLRNVSSMMKQQPIADSRLRISDLQLMNNFSNRTIRNPQSAIRNSTESPCPRVSPW